MAFGVTFSAGGIGNKAGAEEVELAAADILETFEIVILEK
jgi:hypothetical protein